MANGRQSGTAKGSQQNSGDGEKPSTFHHATPGTRPHSDAGYLELLSFSMISAAMGDQKAVTEKWPDILFGFKSFHVQRVAEFAEADYEELSQRVPFLQNTPQPRAIAANASAMVQIARVYGSFRKYLRSFEKDGPAELLRDMAERFGQLDKEICETFLVSAGERVKPPETPVTPQPQKQAQRRGHHPQQRPPRNGGQQTATGKPQTGRQGAGERDSAQSKNRNPRRRRFNWRKRKPSGSGTPAQPVAAGKT